MSEVVVGALDLIASTIPDFPKDVKGHDAQEGDTEELDVVRDPAAADGQATGQPVTVVDLGEKRLGSKLPEKSDIPISPYSTSTLCSFQNYCALQSGDFFLYRKTSLEHSFFYTKP